MSLPVLLPKGGLTYYGDAAFLSPRKYRNKFIWVIFMDKVSVAAEIQNSEPKPEY